MLPNKKMALLYHLIDNLYQYIPLVIFLGSTIIGEEAIILFTILAGQGIIPLEWVIIIGILGIILTDQIIFAIGKSSLTNRIKKWKLFSKEEKKRKTLLNHLKSANPLTILFATKFLYGLRYGSVLYLSMHGLSWRKFSLYSLISALAWAGIITPLAWLAGRGFALGLRIATRLEKLMFFALLIAIVFYTIQYLVNKYLTKPN